MSVLEANRKSHQRNKRYKVSLGKLLELVMDREDWHAWGHKESDMTY